MRHVLWNPFAVYMKESSTYQSLHGAVESMSVVASELGVGSLQGRVTVGLGLLDTIARQVY